MNQLRCVPGVSEAKALAVARRYPSFRALWRVYADGRPDEMVRGGDLIGTPLVTFSRILAAADDAAVFNGTCGAESGWVPVSAVAPSLLFRTLEFQRKEKGQERPPLLAKPGTDGAADAGGSR